MLRADWELNSEDGCEAVVLPVLIPCSAFPCGRTREKKLYEMLSYQRLDVNLSSPSHYNVPAPKLALAAALA